MIAYKSGVRVKRRTLALMHIENCALATQAELGYPKVLVVTSINDGDEHDPDGQHPRDGAVDFRTKGSAANTMLSTHFKKKFRKRFAELLGDRFTVILESLGKPWEHIHAQVRKGQVYP